MLRKPVKLTIVVLGVLLLILVVGWLTLRVLFNLGFKIRDYQERYRECTPQELLLDLEEAFDINFLSDIKELKTAKTPVLDGSILFMVKFSAEPDEVDRFFESFPHSPFRVEFEPYNIDCDKRSLHVRPSPPWFREPIPEGKMGRYRQASGKQRIYIDTTDENSSVVYIDGFYSTSALKD